MCRGLPRAGGRSRARALCIAIPDDRGDESFADDLNMGRGIVSGRVALLLRSTEIRPPVPMICPLVGPGLGYQSRQPTGPTLKLGAQVGRARFGGGSPCGESAQRPTPRGGSTTLVKSKRGEPGNVLAKARQSRQGREGMVRRHGQARPKREPG